MESKLDMEAEYDNRALVPEHVEILPRWEREAAAFRSIHAPDTNEYGPLERNKVDIFRSSDSAASSKPMIVFIHGGYWRGLSKDIFSHMAAGLLENGFDVAMPSYTLCPDISVAGICDEMEACLAFLANSEKRPIMVTGHSAGGHLAAWLCKKDVAARITQPIVAGLGVSGVYDLTPLLHVSMNDDLRLDLKSALSGSPYFANPQDEVFFDVWVGANESSEFLRQSEDFSAKWRENGAYTAYIEIAGTNHFTAIEPLLNKDSLLVKRIVALAS
ncbi:MAG: alpha/beta hydrolase [Hyphomicrobiales bacterium]